MAQHLTYITSARMPTEKAHGVSIAHMCAAFAAQGLSVELVIPSRKNTLSDDICSYYGVPKSFSVRVVPVFDFVGRGYTHPVFFFAQRLLFLRAVKRAGIQPGIVYTREPEVIAAFGKSHVAVYEAHRWSRGVAGWLTAKLVRTAHSIVANSQGTKEAISRRVAVPVLVAPNGFDSVSFSKTTAAREDLGLPSGVLALYVGSTAPWKGVEILQSAAKDLPSGLLSVAIAGSSQKASEGSLRHLGRVQPSLVPAYLKVADILVLPNTRVTEESERFTSPIKLFEYLAAGKAIIASDLPSIREVLTDDAAVFVPPGDVRTLADALTRLATDEKLRSAKGEGARELSAQYTWDARAKRIVAALT
jgi:glycosyltransferase involved in cell wall biosynthesis